MIQPTAPQPTTPGEQSEMGQQLSVLQVKSATQQGGNLLGTMSINITPQNRSCLAFAFLFHSFVDREYTQLSLLRRPFIQ